MTSHWSPTYFKSFIFGVEDSLVSTVGLVSGIALAGVSADTILLTGTVLICVEAFSMAAGEYLSEFETEEYLKQGIVSGHKSLVASLIMFVSYFVSGFIPLFPYLFMPSLSALPYSIGAALIALFVLGMFGARVSRTSYLSHGIRMLLVGGAAIVIGILAGQIAS